MYYPEMEVYDLWYTFKEDGMLKKTGDLCIKSVRTMMKYAR